MTRRSPTLRTSPHAVRALRAARRARGFAQVEYLVVILCVGIVTAFALYRLGPSILKNYREQETILLQKGP